METENKRYYWLKLPKDYFQNYKIRILEAQHDGFIYSLFLLKLMTESISHEGRLRFNEAVPFNEELLAMLTNMDVEIVRNAIRVLTQMDLIEVLDDGTLYLTQVQEMIGSETDRAEKMRELRARRKQELLPNSEHSVTSGNNVTRDKSLENRDKSLDNKDIHSPVSEEKTEQLAKDIYEIISYLNQKTGCRYRESNQKNQSLIKARLKEGFTVEDFKTVIDNKVDDWGHDKEMVKYLRPVTLFGTKFESYLNQKQQSKPVVQDDLSELY